MCGECHQEWLVATDLRRLRESRHFRAKSRRVEYAFRSAQRDHDLEARSMWYCRLVNDVAAMRSRIRLCDRQSEARTAGPASRLCAAREPIKESRDEFPQNALAPIFNGKPQVRVAPSRGHRDGRRAMTQRVGDQVREHTVECRRIPRDLEIRWHRDSHHIRPPRHERSNQLLDLRAE